MIPRPRRRTRLFFEDENKDEDDDDFQEELLDKAPRKAFQQPQSYFFKYFCGLAAKVLRLASDAK